MKIFSLILSVVVFFISLYFFVLKIPFIDSLNDMIYVSLLAILMAICILGTIINWDMLLRDRRRNRIVLFVSNNFSKKK